MKSKGVEETHLQLLQDVSGAFRPGVPTALVGVSVAGKTTLMDVLAGRKTGGTLKEVSAYLVIQRTKQLLLGSAVIVNRTIPIQLVLLSMNLLRTLPGCVLPRKLTRKHERQVCFVLNLISFIL